LKYIVWRKFRAFKTVFGICFPARLILRYEKKMTVTFGDNVKILSSRETDELGLSGKKGQVYGETTPSATGVIVIGQTEDDYALNVFIEEMDQDFWIAPKLLELIDHGEGTEIVVGNLRAVRKADGSWDETVLKVDKKWWQFWK
jgi:hypothetical protein